MKMEVLKPANFLQDSSNEHPQECLNDTARLSTSGAQDRSHRAQAFPCRSDASKVERAVARACKAAGVARLPALQEAVPVRRYERESPGELLHLDTKKLTRFAKPGHRVTGDRTQNTPRAGWQALHVAIDDHSRVGLRMMLTDETAMSACAFLPAALRYYKTLGVKFEQVMTDNGSAYKARRFAKLLRRLGIRHIRTRPYTPRTNGNAERFIQTLLREWAYGFIYPTSDHRARELQPWMYHHNFHRPHSATSHRLPITRLGFDRNNVLSNYI
jgi:transposase InsO family protein